MTVRPLLLVLLLGAAANAAAQTPAAAESSPTAAPAPAARPVSDGPPSRIDPRVCLEFPTRQQIIACANKYLPRRATAKA
jgi:hypothetical protein